MVSRRGTVFLLSALYFVQGLPYGFQITALPVYLRSQGVSLAAIGMASALSLPWVLKLAVGPLVDRFGSARFGRRRTWIVPLQLLLSLACAGGAWTVWSGGLTTELRPLLVWVLLANLFAAVMDVAVDGLAVDLLEPSQLGYGNIAQVVGYKVGMLVGGGLLITLSERLGFGLVGVFLGMALLVLLVGAAALVVPEAAVSRTRAAASGEPSSIRGVLILLGRALRLPGALWLLAFVATYKLGETIADTMLKPFLVDVGYSTGQLGFWLGTYGLALSVLGSIGGGVLASRISPLAAVGWTAVLRAGAVAGEWWLAGLEHPALGALATVVGAEQFFGGALTTALFALMMSRVDRRIGATHYTLLATVEVAGKLGAAQLSGFVAEALGYRGAFLVATVLAGLFLLLLVPMSRSMRVRET